VTGSSDRASGAGGSVDSVNGPARRQRAARAMRAWRAVTVGDVDLTSRVGAVELPNPVMTASGTSGHGDELEAYFPLAELGAVVVKSLSAEPWPGNPAPRVHPAASGMLNSVGLQGPGLKSWLAEDLPSLAGTGARVVASIWGRRVDDFARAAGMLAGVAGIVAVEVNVSCPNLEDERRMFAQSPAATAEVVAAVGEQCPDVPRWAKLSPAVADIAAVAGAALGAGAEAVILVNTVPAMAVDLEARRPVLGSGAAGGGLSGAALHPIAIRAVFEVRAAFPGAAIVGVGGVSTAEDAVEFVMAGADAVQVGTATFLDPRAPVRVLRGLERWCAHHRVRRLGEIRGAAHG
jgi:dihydroorotate dehydrogenase (NAD+) catalytic subunit